MVNQYQIMAAISELDDQNEFHVVVDGFRVDLLDFIVSKEGIGIVCRMPTKSMFSDEKSENNLEKACALVSKLESFMKEIREYEKKGEKNGS